jgi:hypothetical protein
MNGRFRQSSERVRDAGHRRDRDCHAADLWRNRAVLASVKA